MNSMTKLTLIICSSLFLLSGCLEKSTTIEIAATAPKLTWVKQLGAVFAAASGVDTSDGDACLSVAVDAQKNIYCAGSTTGSIADTNGGQMDVLIVKFSPTGEVIWKTQLGSNYELAEGADKANGNENCNDIAVDHLGNVFCGGYTDGNLGDISGGWEDAFVLKLNSSGVFQWIYQVTGASTDMCDGIAVDPSGNVYCGGRTASTMFDVGGGSDDIMVFKLDTNGIVQWATQLGNTYESGGTQSDDADQCWKIALDTAGNVYCGGHTYGSFAAVNAGGRDILIVKFDTAGNVVWAKQSGESGDDEVYALTVSGSDVIFGGQTKSNLADLNGGGYDGFVGKMSTFDGSLSWLKQFGKATMGASKVSSGDTVTGLAVDSSGNIYAAGNTSGNFGETSAGLGDTFIVKLKSTGSVSWVKQFGAQTLGAGKGTQSDNTHSLKFDGTSLVGAGYTFSTLGEAPGWQDVFIFKIDL